MENSLSSFNRLISPQMEWDNQLELDAYNGTTFIGNSHYEYAWCQETQTSACCVDAYVRFVEKPRACRGEATLVEKLWSPMWVASTATFARKPLSMSQKIVRQLKPTIITTPHTTLTTCLVGAVNSEFFVVNFVNILRNDVMCLKLWIITCFIKLITFIHWKLKVWIIIYLIKLASFLKNRHKESFPMFNDSMYVPTSLDTCTLVF